MRKRKKEREVCCWKRNLNHPLPLHFVSFQKPLFKMGFLFVVPVLVLGVALALFGYKVHEERHVKIIGTETGDKRLAWAYWVGACGSLVSLIAAFFYTCEGCRGHSHDGYTRGEVV